MQDTNDSAFLMPPFRKTDAPEGSRTAFGRAGGGIKKASAEAEASRSSGATEGHEGDDWEDWVLVVATRCEAWRASKEELRHARTPRVVARVSVEMHAVLLTAPRTKGAR